ASLWARPHLDGAQPLHEGPANRPPMASAGGPPHRRELKPKWLEKKKQELLSSKVYVNHKKKEAHCFRCMIAKSRLENKPWSFSMGNGIGKWYPVYRRTLQKWQKSMGPLSADV